ncbi:MAG: hypothetical protein EAZ65_06070 [Verrucomicrobia bacterium]|nr:MAG: hypothetical protein EAZ82_07065 [Verrucomicrobiota bacterium]TAF25354.1 MAG: hypothetical protein EAZ71_07680 [Verrucomicrobiota bacterium]TAF41141.1 MAG: hypothetical protein EAZ65_06070 [Verrucomicrobiota bacterium]
MRMFLRLVVCWVTVLRAFGQVVVPVEVGESAVAAVAELGARVVRGEHQVAIERMHPRWKESVAEREGGMAKLEEKLAGIGKMMVEQGVQLKSFRPEGSWTAYEVGLGKELVAEEGRTVEKMIYKQWLLLIPTATVYRIAKPVVAGESPGFVEITSHGFQVAISDKGKNDWTFIDGAGVTVPELRRLFITLPDHLQLPEIKREHKEVK